MFTIPGAMAYADWSLLLLRLMLSLVFGTSGFKHLRHPKVRAASIGMSVPFTIFLGAAECAGALGVAAGVMAPWAALGRVNTN
jgi:putative oxidoreductase